MDLSTEKVKLELIDKENLLIYDKTRVKYQISISHYILLHL